MKNYTPERRIEILKIANEIGTVKASALYGISARTLQKWKKRFGEEGIFGLTNASKKNKVHPGKKIDDTLLKKIINLKKNNINISASQIKKELNINVSLTTIYKKLNEINLVSDRNNGEKNTFFKKIYLSVKKIKYNQTIVPTNNYNDNLPSYKITISDLKSGISFSGFCHERLDIYIAIFADYLFAAIINEGLTLTNSQLFIHSSILSSKQSFLRDEIVKKYKIKIVKENNQIVKENNYPLFKNDFFKSTDELIVKTNALNLINNMTLFNLNCNLFKNRGKKIKNLIYRLIPIISEHFLMNFNTICKKDHEAYPYIKIEIVKKRTINSLDYITGKIDNNQMGLKKVLELYDFVYKSFKYLKIIKKQTEIKLQQAVTRLNTGDKYEAEKDLLEVLNLSKKNDLLNNIPKVYRMLGYKYMNDGDYKKASFYYNKHQNISLKNNNLQELGISYLNFNMLYVYTENIKKRGSLLNKACRIFTDLNDISLHIHTLVDFGIYYIDKEDYKNSEKKLLQALKLSENFGKQKDIPRIHTNLGIISYMTEEYKTSLEYYNLALTEYTAREDHFNAAQVLNNIGNIYLNKLWYDKALTSFYNLLDISKKLNDNRLKAIAYGNIAIVYNSIKKYKIAEKLVNKAIFLSKKNENITDLLEYSSTKINIKLNQNRLVDAAKFNKKNRVLAENHNISEFVFKAEIIDLQINYRLILDLAVSPEKGDDAVANKKKITDKIIKIIKRFLENIICEEKNEDHLALLYFELWKLLKKLQESDFIIDQKIISGKKQFDLKDINFFQKKAKRLYLKLNRQTKNNPYQEFIDELTANS